MEYATPAVREILEEQIGSKYSGNPFESRPTEKENQNYYKSIADEAAESFGGRPFTPEELMQRICNIRDGRAPDQDHDDWIPEDDFEDSFGFGGAGWGFAEEELRPAPDSEFPNPYEVLGVARDADQQTIKAAFRQLAHKHHPDIGGDKETAQRIIIAYETLSDAGKRAYYNANGTIKGYRKR